MLTDIWVLAEHNDRQLESTTWEMLTEARKLADNVPERVCACAIGVQAEAYVASLCQYGARKVYLVENEGRPEYSADGHVHILKELIAKYRPCIMMIGATPVGSELAARIAAKLRLPCITEVKKLSFSGRRVSVAKSGFNDKVYLNFDFAPKKTLVVTLLPGDVERDELQEHVDPEIIRENIPVPWDRTHTTNRNFIKGDPRMIDLEEADVVIAAGKGVDTEGFARLEQLANILGASIGATRPLIDEGIVPHHRQIGITGKSISPKVLIACGISGAREFTGGIESAKLTIAINTDAKARIFKAVDMGVLGDVNEVIPALIENLKKRERSQ
jgi:electron transfer flavoprotein alpha subunit